jgi:hypothetical protein
MLTIAARYWSDKGWPIHSPTEIPGDVLLIAIAVAVVLVGAAFFALLAGVAFTLNVGTVRALGTAFRGAGTYSRTAYAFAAYSCPLLVLAGVVAGASSPFWFGALPARPAAVAVLALGVYLLALNVLAVKGVYGIGWVGSVVAGGAFQVAILIGLGLATFFLFLLHWFLLGTMLFGA